MICAGLLVACSRQDGAQTDASTRQGVLVLTPPTPADARIEVEVYPPGDKHWFWNPTEFPARLSLPLGARFTLHAESDGYLPFTAVRSLTPWQEEVVVRIKMEPEVVSGSFGYGVREIPADIGLQSVVPAVRGQHGTPAFGYFVFDLSKEERPPPASLVVDVDGKVWQNYTATDCGEPGFWWRAWVDKSSVERMLALVDEYRSTQEVPFRGPCIHCSGMLLVSANVPNDGGTRAWVSLAWDGGATQRRENAAANRLLPWLSAVFLWRMIPLRPCEG